MPVGKRMRFEVLRRDNHTCRYCGAHAPDVELAVDHVIPEALGGATVPENLTTACVDCNAGKASIGPDAPIVDDVAQDSFRWQRAIRDAADQIAAGVDAENEKIGRFDEVWCGWHVGHDPDAHVPRSSNWRQTVLGFYRSGLPEVQIFELVRVSMESTAAVENKWRYYCGCVRNAVRQLHDTALEILEAEGAFMDEGQAVRQQYERLAEQQP